MAKNNDDKLTQTGENQINYYRAKQRNSKSFWDKVDTADHALQKSQAMADSYYGDKASKVKDTLKAYDTSGDFPTNQSIVDDATAAKRLKAKVLADSAVNRKRLIDDYRNRNYAKGGKPKKMAKGGSVSSASKRADGCATKGKTKGRFV